MKILAHRGIHEKVMENSLESFRLVRGSNVDGVELDIRLTRDEKIVVFHDEDLKRLFEVDERVADMSLSRIKEIALKSGTHVPSLEEVLELLYPDYIINIEIKETQVVFPLFELLKQMKLDMERVIFSSFIHNALSPLKEEIEGAKIGLLIGNEAEGFSDPIDYLNTEIIKYKPFSIHLPVQSFERFDKDILINALGLLKDKTGVKYAWWTVNTLEQFDPLFKNPQVCDYCISDNTQFIIERIEKGE